MRERDRECVCVCVFLCVCVCVCLCMYVSARMYLLMIWGWWEGRGEEGMVVLNIEMDAILLLVLLFFGLRFVGIFCPKRVVVDGLLWDRKVGRKSRTKVYFK